MPVEGKGDSPAVKVAHLTSCHPAFDPRIFHRECRSLARAGYSVTLVVPGDHDAECSGVLIATFQKPKSRLHRFLLGSLRILRKALAVDASLYHIHDPDLIPVAVALRLIGKRVIYDVHEDVPRQILVKHWIPKLFRRLIALAVAAIEIATAKCIFDGIVAATPTIGKRFPPRKTVVVRNFPELGFANPGPPFKERKNDIVYIGGLNEARGLREMMRAVSELSRDLDARLILAGGLESSLSEEEVRSWMGFDRTVFLGNLSRDQISNLLSTAKVGLCILHRVPNIVGSYPTKVFEYMAAGLPVVISNFLIPDLLGSFESGFFVDPQNTTEVATAITDVLVNSQKAELMGQAGRRAVQTQFNWSHEAKALLGLYDRLTMGNSVLVRAAEVR